MVLHEHAERHFGWTTDQEWTARLQDALDAIFERGVTRTMYGPSGALAIINRWLKVAHGMPVVLPVSAIEHSGVAVYLGNGAHPHDPGGWDSGWIGWLFVTREQAARWGLDDPVKIAERAHASFQEFAAWVSGEVLGFQILAPEGNALINAVGSERWLARRIRHERVARGWSQAGLSELMAGSGHPLHQSAISKIEAPPAGEGPRMVTIDEAIGFPKVFGIPLGELLLPPKAGLSADLRRRYRQAVERHERARAALVTYADMLEYELSVPAESAVPGATDTFLAQLKEYRDRLESEEKSRQRALVGKSYYGHYIQNYERPSELLVANDILDAAARPSEEN